MPNVGKSTLFNALTSSEQAEIANYPFCTIEPNSGRVRVPDPRLGRIADAANSGKVVPTYLEFVDIAGLVKGASVGEGLGNQFLANIREVDAIVHVLRCFTDSNITHVDRNVNPVRDAEIVETELMLADLQSLEKMLDPLSKKVRAGDKDTKAKFDLLERVFEVLKDGQPARRTILKNEERTQFQNLQLLTSKPVLYVCNVGEDNASGGNKLSESVSVHAEAQGAAFVVISAKIEAELSQLSDPEEKKQFLEAIGLEETGLDQLVRAGYNLLSLITYFTAGPKESRAWTIQKGTKAAEAAGYIHTDFERGFICAETIAGLDYLELGGEQACKDVGKMRQEGKDYLIRDGDVIFYRFNV